MPLVSFVMLAMCVGRCDAVLKRTEIHCRFAQDYPVNTGAVAAFQGCSGTEP